MSALDIQIGGGHYKEMPIQPMEFSMANKLDACQHTVIKYVTRFREKGGIQDLEKARHVIDMLIEFEQRLEKEQVKKENDPRQTSFAFTSTDQIQEKASPDRTTEMRAGIDRAIATLNKQIREAKAAEQAAAETECDCIGCALKRALGVSHPGAEIELVFLGEDSGRTD